MAAAPGAPGHVLSYMHALEIMQQYAQVLAAARQLLLMTRYLGATALCGCQSRQLSLLPFRNCCDNCGSG